jgi:hypothetical protein
VKSPIGKRKCYACSSAKKAAKAKQVPFALESRTLPDIPDLCPLCDRHMVEGGSRKRVPSLDRILPDLGYTLINVWWICHDCNRQKSDLDPARAYALWDEVWEEMKRRGLTCGTRLHPIHSESGDKRLDSPPVADRIGCDDREQALFLSHTTGRKTR